jgi:hypothetical protein
MTSFKLKDPEYQARVRASFERQEAAMKHNAPTSEAPDHPTYACSAPSTNARDCVKKRDPHDNEDYDLRRNELVLRHARPIKEAVNQQAERIA